MKNKITVSIVLACCLNFFVFAVVSAASQYNELGKIPVLEYHQIADYEARWTRNIENFKKDLEFLYNNDYYPISVANFVSGEIDVPAGKKPVVLTFDDGSQGQFNILENEEIDADSAVGAMLQFCKEKTDFDCRAIFYVNALPFKQKDLVAKKLNFLIENGFEIGNHTLTHADLAKSNNINYELGELNNRVLDWLNVEFKIESLAYPFGAYPKAEGEMNKIKSGSHDGNNYKITNAFLVGAEPSFSPYHKNFNPYKIPRIQAIEEEWIRHFNRYNSSTEKITEKFKPFISDGDVSKISFLEEDKDLLAAQYVEGKTKFKQKIVNSEKKHLEVDIEKEEKKMDENFAVTENSFIKPIAIKDDFVQMPVNAYKDMFDFFQPLVEKVEIKNVPNNLEVKNNRFYYQVSDGDSYESIAERFVWESSFSSVPKFIEAIKVKNEGLDLKTGNVLEIPGILLLQLPSVLEVKNPRGIYLTAYSVKQSGKEFADSLASYGGNMIVFDVKAGKLGYKSDLSQVKELNDQSGGAYNLEEWIEYLHEKNIYTVGRLVAFKDANVAAQRRDWNLMKKGTKSYWSNNEGAIWLDPTHPEVKEYLKAITLELAQKGIDEIQYDYVRFPATGTAKTFSFVGEERGLNREQAITEFVTEMKKAVEPYGTKISVDVFGVAGWSALDASIVGQNIPELAKVVDVIYPMIYPSHFGAGYNGHPDPANDPYYFVQESTKKFLKLAEGGKAEIRPWFQGFPLGVRNFGDWYLLDQKKAINDIGLDSFVVWSPGNKYAVTWSSLYDAFPEEE